MLNNIEITDRKKIFSYALALSVAKKLPMPSSAVENPSGYFITNLESSSNAAVSEFNEKVIINVEETKEFIRKYWNIRYYALHNAENYISIYPYGFFDSILGVGNYISEDMHLFLNKYKANIIELSNKISALINTIAISK